jgi:hypothetical protein
MTKFKCTGITGEENENKKLSIFYQDVHDSMPRNICYAVNYNADILIFSNTDRVSMFV